MRNFLTCSEEAGITWPRWICCGVAFQTACAGSAKPIEEIENMKDQNAISNQVNHCWSSSTRLLHLLVLALLLVTLGTAAAAGEIKSFHQLAPSQGWVLTNNHLLVTDSAGTRWTEISPATAGNIDGVFFLDRASAWAVVSSVDPVAGLVPRIARTTDGGAHWAVSGFTTSDSETNTAVYSGTASISFVDAAHGFVLLRSATSPNFSTGILLATSDGGASWSRRPDPPIADGLTFVTRRNGWLAGGPDGSQVFVTRDGGNSWRAARIPRPAAGELSFEPPVFHDALHGTLAAKLTSGDSSVAAVFITRNAGHSWLLESAGPIKEAALASSAQTIIPGASFVRAELSSGGDGWLHVVAGVCTGIKTGCTQSAHLLSISAGVVTEITPPQAASGPLPFASTTISTFSGFDKCSAGTVAQMSTWWASSPYFDANIYIGGVARGCSQPNLTASWVTSIFGQGWRLIPTWVGPQAPCSTFTSKISTNTTTAFNQGVNEAASAISAANALGLSTSIVYYDMENYNSGDATCKAAVNSFINGWVQRMHSSSFLAGVYGSATNANSGWATIANVPNNVWIALWNGVASTTGLSPLPDSLWSNSQRIHQYAGGHNETWGGITFNIDNDIENGRVAAP
jgi:photosystem II stability/assembly factor-like uncharacterized protein